MTVSFRTVGTWAELTADGSVAIPATPQAGDRMYLFARWKDFSITAQVTSPSGWTELVEFADGSAASGNGTGSVKVGCWYRDWQSGDTDPTLDFSASPTNASVVIIVMAKAATDTWLTPVAVTAAMTNWTTSSQTASASSTVEVLGGGAVIGLIGIRDDTAVMTRPSSGIDDSAAAITWNGNYVEAPATHHSTTTGDDGAADLGYRLVSAGATATLRMTGTISAAETGTALWVVQGVQANLVIDNATHIHSVENLALHQVNSLSVAGSNHTHSSDNLSLAQVNSLAVQNTSHEHASQVPTLTQVNLLDIQSASHGHNSENLSLEVIQHLEIQNASHNHAAELISLEHVHNLTINDGVSNHGVESLDLTQIHELLVDDALHSHTSQNPNVRTFLPVFLDPGGDATHAVGHLNQLIAGFGSDVTYDDMQQVAGSGSYRFDSNTNENPAVVVPSVLGPARRVSAYLRFGSVPDAVVTTTRFPSVFAVYSGGGFTDSSFLDQDDGNYATATPARNAGQGQVCSNFGFDSIPVGAAIVSVKIIYEVTLNTIDSIGISRAKYRLNGEEGPDHDDTSEPAVDTVIEADITNDRDWRREDLLDGVFQIIAEARRGDTDTAHTQSWDYVKVQVIYRQDAIFQIVDDVNEPCWHIGLVPRDDHCVVRFADGEGVDYYGITKLFAGTNNRISFAYKEHAGGLDINIFVNWVAEMSLVDVARGATVERAAHSLRYGWVNSPGIDHVCWLSHLWIDDGDDLQDSGNVLSTAKLPATVHENNWSTTVGTGAVDERPLSETNHMRHNPATGARQTYTLQASSVGDVDISSEVYRAHMGWAWARATSTAVEEISLVVNGVLIDRTLQIANTPSLLKAAVASIIYPSNAAGVGMTGNIDTADVLMFECGVIVAYEGSPDNPLLPMQILMEDSVTPLIDDLRADPPDTYEVFLEVSESGAQVEVEAYVVTFEGQEPQLRDRLFSGGGSARVPINSPGIEVSFIIRVTEANAYVRLRRRLNV